MLSANKILFMSTKTPTPTILIDTREQTPLTFAHFPTERATLPTGDYSARGLETCFCVERIKEAEELRRLYATG